MINRIPAIALAVALAATLNGCGGPGPVAAQPSASPSISQQQAKALEDDDVTWDEYETAFKAYEACMAEAGFTLANPRLEGDLMEAGIPGTAVDSGDDARCYDFYWSDVDGVWQIAHEDTSPSAKIIAYCLRVNDIAPEEKYQKNLLLLEQHGINPADCPVVE